MRVDDFRGITYLASGSMDDESVLFGKCLSEGSVKLAISISTD